MQQRTVKLQCRNTSACNWDTHAMVEITLFAVSFGMSIQTDLCQEYRDQHVYPYILANVYGWTLVSRSTSASKQSAGTKQCSTIATLQIKVHTNAPHNVSSIRKQPWNKSYIHCKIDIGSSRQQSLQNFDIILLSSNIDRGGSSLWEGGHM